MKRKYVCRAGLCLLVLLAVIPVSSAVALRKSAEKASRKVSELPPYDMVHVLLYGYDRDTVSGRITLYSEDGNAIAEIERSWNADAVVISFAQVTLGSGTFIFPYKVTHTGMEKFSQGIYLPNYYLSARKCHLLSAHKAEDIQKEYVSIARFATSRFPALLSPSRTILDVNLSQCRPGVEYQIRFSADGTPTVAPVAGW